MLALFSLAFLLAARVQRQNERGASHEGLR
jgi:hypothetical protein